MKTHPKSTLLPWAEKQGIVLDPRYPRSGSFILDSGTQCERFWCIPTEPERRPWFLRCMLQAFGEWASFRCWHRLWGHWPSDPDPSCVNDQVEHAIIQGLGLPVGTDDIVEFSPDEEVSLLTLLLCTSIFGGSVGQDLYLVPDTAIGFLVISHHQVVHAAFRSEVQMNSFIRFMASEDFPLPDELPDATFKKPDWMSEN